jgi:hypothetical protein
MINNQVYQIVAEENSSSLLPAKTGNCLFPADRSWTPREIGWTVTSVSPEAAGVSLEAQEKGSGRFTN